jgi:hypothetical protein
MGNKFPIVRNVNELLMFHVELFNNPIQCASWSHYILTIHMGALNGVIFVYADYGAANHKAY